MICSVWNFCDLLSIYWRTIKVETETGYMTCLLIVDDNTRRKRITKFSVYWQYIYLFFLKKKKSAHAYFEHRIFLSFLAGKFTTFEQMLLTEWMSNTWRMRPLTAHICLSFLAWKILTRKSPWNNNFPLLDRDLAVCSSDSKSGTSVLYLLMNRVLYWDRSISCLNRAWDIRDIHLSVWKKKWM